MSGEVRGQGWEEGKDTDGEEDGDTLHMTL
jgi:hypothetical protein